MSDCTWTLGFHCLHVLSCVCCVGLRYFLAPYTGLSGHVMIPGVFGSGQVQMCRHVVSVFEGGVGVLRFLNCTTCLNTLGLFCNYREPIVPAILPFGFLSAGCLIPKTCASRRIAACRSSRMLALCCSDKPPSARQGICKMGCDAQGCLERRLTDQVGAAAAR